MELSLFERAGKTWTRFKISAKQFEKYEPYLRYKFWIDTKNPIKKNERFIYFEKEGDWINEK